jgi:hypothetical protein
VLEQRDETREEKVQMLLELAASTIAIHVIPNVVMKAVKSTKKGHKFLTSTLALGVEHGKKARKFQFNFQSMVEYGMGPEITAEYQIGLKLGKELRDLPEELHREFLLSFTATVRERMEELDESEREEVMSTPILNAIIAYVEGEYSSKMAKSNAFSVSEDSKTTVRHYAVNVAVLGLVAAVNAHLLAQPVISFVRKKFAVSKFGKSFMKKSFERGLEGHRISKAKMIATDLLVSPAALDTLRIGTTLRKMDVR